MYVPTAGMGRYRGMGDVMNCPGDPGCPGYVAPGSEEYQTSLLQEILANQQTTTATDTGNVCDTTSKMFDASICNNLYVPKSGSNSSALSSWNLTTVSIYAAVGVGLFLLMRGR